VTELRCFKT